METIGDRLKKLRNEYKFTQKELGDYLGFDQSHIAKLENNKRQLRTDTLDELCNLYNCSEEHIINGNSSNVKKKYNIKSKISNIDLNTIAVMNSIIRNLSYLSSLFEGKKYKTYSYNKHLNQDAIIKANDCRRTWNINEYTPIDMINVCLNKFENLTIVFFKANENMTGSSLIIGNEMLIFVNSKHSLGRQRLTIAHQLYHLLYGDNEFVNCPIKNDTKIEKLADEFASYLLMSDRALLNYKREKNINKWQLDEILSCEQYFQINRPTLLQRLKNIGEIDEKQYKEYNQRIKYNAKKRGFDTKLYSHYSEENLLMGNYIRLTQDAYNQGLITKGRRDELLRYAFYYNFINNEGLEDLFA